MTNQRTLSDAEEAEIAAEIAADPDDEVSSDQQLAEARPFGEVFPDLMASIKRGRGRPKLENAKQPVTLRLSPLTLEKFRAAGPDWRERMTEVLDKAKVS